MLCVCVHARGVFAVSAELGLFGGVTKPDWFVVHLVLERTFALVNLVLRALNYTGAVIRQPANQETKRRLRPPYAVNYSREKLVRYLGTNLTESEPNFANAEAAANAAANAGANACLPTRCRVLFCIDTPF